MQNDWSSVYKKMYLIDYLRGGRRGIRTPNLLIWNQPLYRWSYTPITKQKIRHWRMIKQVGQVYLTDLVQNSLFYDIRYCTSTDRTSTFANRETKTFFHRYWSNKLNTERSIIAWHNHLHTFVKSD